MLAVLVEHLAVDQSVLDSLRWHHEPAPSTRQIALHLGPLGGTHRPLIENGHIGGKASIEPAAVLQSEEVRRFGGDSLDRLLQRERLALAYPCAEQVCAIARIAEHV